jgi:DNA-binding GntR family transcriptional regulator
MTARLEPIDNENLGQKAYQVLRSALADGRYQPGERLRLRDLADELGISVTPVRDAVLQLVWDGALQMKTSRDIRVRELSTGEYAQIALIRGQLEGLAVERFADRMTPDDLEQLVRLEEKHRAALAERDYRAALMHDRRLMFTIFETIDMPMLLETLDRLWLVARPTVGLLYSDAGVARADIGNQALIDALATGDGRAAVEARRNQITEWAEVIVVLLGKDEHTSAVNV